MVDQPNNPLMTMLGGLMDKSQEAVAAARKAAEDEKDSERKRQLDAHLVELSQKADLLQALLSFFTEMFFGESLADYDDFGATPQETEQDRSEAITRDNAYTGDRDAFRRSGRDSFTSGTVTQYQSRLAAMRQSYGEGLQTEMPFAENGHVNSPRGMRKHPVLGVEKMHQGMDMVADNGSAPDILATMPGIVVAKGRQGAAGNVVEILDIYNVRHRFFHLADGSLDDLKVGQEVKQGDKIGVMGATGRVTGVHLHYEQVDAKGNRRDPIIQDKEWGRNDHFAGADGHGHEQHAEAKPVAVAKLSKPNAEPAHPAHVAARAAVSNMKTQVAAVVSHPPQAAHESGLDYALTQAKNMANGLALKARSLFA